MDDQQRAHRFARMHLLVQPDERQGREGHKGSRQQERLQTVPHAVRSQKIGQLVVGVQDNAKEPRCGLQVHSDGREKEGQGMFDGSGDADLGWADDAPPQLLIDEDGDIVATGDEGGDDFASVKVQGHLGGLYGHTGEGLGRDLVRTFS